MDLIQDLVHIATDPRSLLALFGPFAYLGLFAIIFAETGLFVGFFLPGDSLLFVAGVLASLGTHGFQLPIVIAICVAAAIAGNLVGYAFGKRVGRPLFDRPESRFFKRSHLVAAESFYARHGGATIVLARFLPFIRTFAPIVAGIGNMPARTFVTYSVAGGVLWGTALPIAGYLFGRVLGDNIDRYLLPIIVLIVAASLTPAFLRLAQANRHRLWGRLDRASGTPGAMPDAEQREP